ncbi:HNH endonuclease signature motif containing protein [Streptomyces yaizuensis]|uniref:HPC2 multi-domain protein n=1 Tax=Streptomyces yaizuensis TaxID=2989713 RepID=A0ABQ5P933_9ACTN|nr:HNH endonuclease signature motif containing protein [Streptomyces sp. YSPA8]GLF99091.1 HPC2 multi-domain protein [Streptomyces sp. YSPA8]
MALARTRAPRPKAVAPIPAPVRDRAEAHAAGARPPGPVSNAAMAAALVSRPGSRPPGPPPGAAAQAPVGNSAVAAARGGGAPAAGPTTEPQATPAAAPAPGGAGQAAAGGARRPGPHADPKFAALKQDVRRKKRAVSSSHPPARTEADAAHAAALPPKDDAQAQGKSANAERMNEAKPKDFDKEAFIAAVEKAIKEKAPKNLDEADKFADSGKADEVRAEVQGKVGDGKEQSAGEIATTTAAPPDTSAAVPKPVTPLAADRPPGTPAPPNAANAVPDRLPPSATDLSAGPARVQGRMAAAQITEGQLRKANEPAFTQALGHKKTAEQHSATAPGRMRKAEAAELNGATAQARKAGAAAMGAISAQRVAAGRRVGAGKEGAKARDEEKRAKVATVLQGVFDVMKKDVETILSGLDKLVDDQFTAGEKEARDAFTAEHRQKMEEYKDRRYGGPGGSLRWLRDLFAGLPAEADRIFDQAREGYLRRMRQVISQVATTIGTQLGKAKKRIADGRTEMRTAVNGLPADLRAIGREAAAGFEDRFAELTQSVDDKGTELVDTLATRYTDALKSVDDEIAVERERNKGLVAKAVEAVKGVIDTILELKRLLLAVLAKAAQAVMMILTDPIGFLGNLVRAVGAGLRQFLSNIGTHLRQGIMSWLLGQATEAGIQLPAKFDTQGVLSLLASLLGLTWANIRSRITRRVPERLVAAAETALPIIAEVRRRGVAALWDDLKARVGDLRKNLLDKVIEYVVPTIVTAGITWILSLLNPASAFVRAVKLIIDVITFVVTQGRRVIEFVNAVLDAVIAIARGGSGGVPALVERALARSIPVLLGFLASLLGIGGIAAKVKQIVQALARPVNTAVDWVLDKIIGLIKKLGSKLAAKFTRKFTRKDKRTPEEQDKALGAALSDARGLVKPDSTVESLRKGLPPIRRRHKLSALTLVVEQGGQSGQGAQGAQGATSRAVHFKASINPSQTSPPVLIKGGGPGLYKARKVDDQTFTGDFANFIQSAWSRYDLLRPIDKHPGNVHFNRADGTVPRPSGTYTVPGGSTGGAQFTEAWRTELRRRADAEKDKLLRNNPQRNQPGQRDRAEKNAKNEVASQLGMAWLDLYMVNPWDEHHIKPVNWGGTNDVHNLIFIRREQHRPITSFFESIKADIRKDIS